MLIGIIKQWGQDNDSPQLIKVVTPTATTTTAVETTTITNINNALT